MIKVVFFDVGGVLLFEEDFEKVFHEFGERTGLSPGLSARLHRKYMRRLNHGRISTDEFLAIVQRQVKARMDLKKLWVKIAMKHVSVKKGTLKIADKLRGRYRVVVLSNANELTEVLDRKLGLHTHFDSMLISYALRMRKPNKNMFLFALKHSGAKPEEAVLIDDRERNIKAAKRLGIEGFVYKNDRQLARDLRRIGVKI